MRKMLIVLVALLGALGCNKKSSDDPVEAPPEEPKVADFGNALLAAMSLRVAECQGMTADAARQLLQERLKPQLMAEAQDAGRIALDPVRAQACLDWLPRASCAELKDPAAVADCVGAFIPKVEEGDDCTLFVDAGTTAECIAGECVANSDLACVTHGTCVRFGTEGEACEVGWWSRDCGEGLTCSYDGESPKCVAVATHTGVGDPCNDQLNRCGPSLYCDGSVCQAQVATGQDCGGDEECAYGDYCNETCVAYKQVDAACTPGSDRCVDGAFCDTATLKCIANPTVGGNCNGQDRYCIDSWCDMPLVGVSLVGMPAPATGTCKAFHAEGEACTPAQLDGYGPSDSGECGPTAICDRVTSTCIRFLCGAAEK